jgi:chemotaxis signal transduction protein
MQEQYMELVLGKEYFAMNTRDIYKMIKAEAAEVTTKPRPCTNEPLFLHGKEVPVISLRRLLDMPEAALTKAARIIVIRHNGGYAGFIVDQVNKVTGYDIIQAVSGKAGTARRSFLSGACQSDGKQVSIINTDELLIRLLERAGAELRL